MADNKYSADYAKRLAKCKRCKQNLEKGCLRLAKVTASPFSDDGEMKIYHHPKCLFESFLKMKATSKVVEEPGDIENWEVLTDEDKKEVKKLIKESEENRANKGTKGKKATPKKKAPATPAKKASPVPAAKKEKETKKAPSEDESEESTATKETRAPQGDLDHKDNAFREFRRLCAKVSDDPSSLAKCAVIKDFFSRGADKNKFQGDLYVWVRLFLPGTIKRVYNVQSKGLVKIFSRIFGAKEDDMLEDLEKGDVAETVTKFLERSKRVDYASKSKLTVHQVDDFLDRMTGLTKEDEQAAEITKLVKLCTPNDLKMVVRLIKADLRIGAGQKPVLDAVHKDAHEAFNSSRNIYAVLDSVIELKEKGTPNASLDVGVSLLHPIQPMLAAACKSVDMAFNKCPNGMFSEIKYDGERVQLHKKGNEFKYFSRSLKPVLDHKVKHFKDYIPKAFKDASDIILDAEVLMVDNKTGDPLPFGTLGKHKKEGFSDATPCLFVFDCIYYNGKSLLNKPISSRRKFLEDHMVEVGNHVKFSEYEYITRKEQLGNMIRKVLRQGLEGLVLKDVKSTYEPGKRHWLKVKKDYLNDGAMADTADLVVLGAWFGTGVKGGIMSVFLMGCYDPKTKTWRTVSKASGGHDDETLERLQKELAPNMKKIGKDYDSLPGWIRCSRTMAPDYIARDPKKSPVWEITGAEFSSSDNHTADGISIRFPRVTKIRDDKTWQTATNLEELKKLFEASKESTDFDIDYSTKDSDVKEKKVDKKELKREAEAYDDDTDEDDREPSPKKVKREPIVYDIKSESSSCTGGKSFNKLLIENPESGFKLEMVKGDLFKASKSTSLAHCISRDCRLGKGIAKIFRDKYGRIDEIKDCRADIGQAATLKDRERYIYNLVTKEKYNDKPTYRTLEMSLMDMRKHALRNGVSDIALPKIGCGLDGLKWNAVRTLLKNVFLKEDIRLTVYVLGDEWDSLERESTDSKRRTPVKREFKTEPAFDIRDMLGGKRKIKEEDDSPRRDASDSDEPPRVKKSKPDTELSDCFEGVKMILNKGVPGQERLRRYVIAFGGEMLQDHEVKDATHFVHGDGEGPKGSDGSCKHVRHKWLVDSVMKKKLQREKDYSI